MKVRRNRKRPTDRQSRRRQAVDAAYPSLERTHGSGCKTCDLLRRVYAGVRPTRGDCTNWRVGHPAERLFENLLHRALAILALPPMETAAVVFEAKRKMMNVRLQLERANGAQG